MQGARHGRRRRGRRTTNDRAARSVREGSSGGGAHTSEHRTARRHPGGAAAALSIALLHTVKRGGLTRGDGLFAHGTLSCLCATLPTRPDRDPYSQGRCRFPLGIFVMLQSELKHRQPASVTRRVVSRAAACAAGENAVGHLKPRASLFPVITRFCITRRLQSWVV